MTAMPQPGAYVGRVERGKRDVKAYREDVEEWKRDHEQLKECWDFEDLVAKASFLFTRILVLDSDYRDFTYQYPDAYDAMVSKDIEWLAAEWLKLSEQLVGDSVRLQDYAIDGLDGLRTQVEEMRAILTPDEVLFDTAHMEQLCEEAVKDHENGATEPLLPIEE